MPRRCIAQRLNDSRGLPYGIATLDANGQLSTAQRPPGGSSPYKGEYPTEAALSVAYPTANQADYAFVEATGTFWYWNAVLGQWVNQEITAADYMALDVGARGAVPYVIVP